MAQPLPPREDQPLSLEGEDAELVYRALLAYQDTEAKKESETRLATAKWAHREERKATQRVLAKVREFIWSRGRDPREVLEEMVADMNADLGGVAPCDVCGKLTVVPPGPAGKLPGEKPWLCDEHKETRGPIQLVSSPRPEGT